MKKLFLSIAAILISCLAQTAFAYNPTQLKAYDNSQPHTCVNCDLSHINSSWVVTNASNSVLHGTNLSYTSANWSTDFSDSNFSNVIASYSDFSGDNFSETNFSNAKLSDTNFKRINATYANFTGAVVSGANFKDADLYGAKLTVSQLATTSNVCHAILPNGSIGRCL